MINDCGRFNTWANLWLQRHECNVDSIHELIYGYSDIECCIVGNNIVLENINPPDYLNHQRIDPEQETSKNHLQCNWNCINLDTNALCANVILNVD